MHMGIKNAYPIGATENNTARPCSPQLPGRVDNTIGVDRIHDSVERRQYPLVPAIPVRVSGARTPIKRRETPGWTAPQVEYETVGTKRVTDKGELTSWMLETDEVLPNEWMDHHRSDAIESQDAPNLRPSGCRRQAHCVGKSGKVEEG